MSFSKLLILKSINDKFFSNGKIIGVVKVEKTENSISFNFDFYASLPANSFLLVADNTCDYTFTLSNNLKQTITLYKNLIVENFTICLFIQNTCEIYGLTYNGNCKISLEKLEKLLKNNLTPLKDDYNYDDEQIASENYYAKHGVRYQNENSNGYNLQTKKEEENGTSFMLNEKLSSSNENYFLKVQDKVNNLLKNNKRNEFLNEVYKNSIFVDVQYAKSSHYTFGIIYDDFKNAKYICYVVLGSYSKIPKGFEKISKFIPLKSYLPYDDGYFIIFQDAISGKTLI